jgi:hypothetical protein
LQTAKATLRIDSAALQTVKAPPQIRRAPLQTAKATLRIDSVALQTAKALP